MQKIDLNSANIPEGDYLEMCLCIKNIYQVLSKPSVHRLFEPRQRVFNPRLPIIDAEIKKIEKEMDKIKPWLYMTKKREIMALINEARKFNVVLSANPTIVELEEKAGIKITNVPLFVRTYIKNVNDLYVPRRRVLRAKLQELRMEKLEIEIIN